MTKVIKEIIIMLLICLISMLVFAIAFYDYIPNRKNVDQVAIYTTSAETEALLADDIDSEKKEVVLTYEVTSKDLNTFEGKNEYVPGKSNPFEAYSDGTEGSSDGDTTTDNTDTNDSTEKPSENTNTSNSSSSIEEQDNDDEDTDSTTDDGGLK